MCYHKSQGKLTLFEELSLGDYKVKISNYRGELRNYHNGFNYAQSAVLKPSLNEDGIELVPMEWGFVPSYVRSKEDLEKMRKGYMSAKGYRPALTTLNAKAEEMLNPGKIYRDAALHRRCLVPATGFFEWRHVQQIGKKGQPLKATKKYPYHISVHNKPYFYMAGVWQEYVERETGEVTPTLSIITTAANPLMKVIHNSKERMPTILTDELAQEWVFGDLNEDQITEIASFQYPWQQMDACTVRPDFQVAEEPNEYFEYEDLPAYELDIAEAS